MIKTVCVYCASSSNIEEIYFNEAQKLGELFVRKEIITVFGGGSSGLMGKLADTVIEKNGEIIGIMPNFMKSIEWDHKGVYNFHFVEDMHARKKRFIDSSDALVTLAGGTGTLEELLEAITLKRLGLHDLPIYIINTNGYYDPLIEMLDKTIAEGFMKNGDDKLWTILNSVDELEARL